MSLRTDDPVPPIAGGSATELRWPVQRSFTCPPVALPPPTSFCEVVEERRSCRDLVAAPLREVINVLGFAFRPRFVSEADASRSLRPSLSAGAIHPVQVLLHPRGKGSRVFRYNSLTHHLELLKIRNPAQLRAMQCRCASMLPNACGTLIQLVANEAAVEAKYEQHLSLLWRDAGAALQTLAFVSTAYRLAFCPLGILGYELLAAVGMDAQTTVAVGAALIGRAGSAWNLSSSCGT